MRIQGSNNAGQVQPKTGDAAAKSKEQVDPGATDGAAVVSLGEAAQKASSRLSNEINARLEEVRLQLSRDEYPIDLDLLATRIVDDEFSRAGS